MDLVCLRGFDADCEVVGSHGDVPPEKVGCGIIGVTSSGCE